jgi:hypothetical protein
MIIFASLIYWPAPVAFWLGTLQHKAFLNIYIFPAKRAGFKFLLMCLLPPAARRLLAAVVRRCSFTLHANPACKS